MHEPLAVQGVTGHIAMTGTDLVLRVRPTRIPQPDDVTPNWAASGSPVSPVYSRVATREEWARWRAEYYATVRKFSHPWYSWRRWLPVRWS